MEHYIVGEEPGFDSHVVPYLHGRKDTVMSLKVTQVV